MRKVLRGCRLRYLLIAVAALAGQVLVSDSAYALDAFERHTLPQLRQVVGANKALATITSKELTTLKPLGRGVDSPCLVIKTDAGNLAKALVSFGLRKTANQPIPVLMIDRYVTYDPGRGGQTTAHGKDVMLFPGFAFDFDIGQVVPQDAGGDFEFAGERKIVAQGKAELFPLNGPVELAESSGKKHDPLDHDGILPQDFGGVWRVDADGRWKGTMELECDAEGNISGKYLSADTQSSYAVAGKVDKGTNRASLVIELANSDQLLEAFLWSTDKSVMAGITTMAEKRFGFHATRADEDRGE